jgi:hypothetical protein
LNFANILEEHTVSISRVEKQAMQGTRKASSSTLKIEAVRFSRRVANFTGIHGVTTKEIAGPVFLLIIKLINSAGQELPFTDFIFLTV